MSATRSYRMRARADAAAATRDRILAAARALAFDDLLLEPTLQQVARAAGTTPQTVLRHFGSRAALLEEVERTARELILAERSPASDDDDAALTALLGHYEVRGDFVLAVLGRAGTDDRAAAIAELGRREHRRWVAEVFGDRLPASPADREAVLDLLVVATDLFTWRLLRRDLRLPGDVVADRMRTLIRALLPH